MESIWKRTEKTNKREMLEGSLDTDVAVIGGGLAGILTAYYLKQYGIDAVVLEAGKIGGGQTGNTTAKVTSQHNLIYDRLIGEFGIEKARQYAAANERAIGEYRRLIEKNGIDCQWRDCPAFLYSIEENDILEKEAKAARQLGISAEVVNETELPFHTEAALRFNGQACFHPLKFLNGIADHVKIYENTPVEMIDKCDLKVRHGAVHAGKVVFACHYPFVNFPGYYFMRMHQERSYVLALEQTQELEGMYLGIDNPSLSFRSYGKYLLLGGEGHRTGENSQGGRYDRLREWSREFWPQCTVASKWSAQDAMPMDGIPYIGEFSSSTPDWYVATGFGKWGMTSSMAAALILSDAITGKKNPHADVFSPQRFHFSASAKSLVEDGLKAAVGLTREIFHLPAEKGEELQPGHGGIVEWDGKKAGVYKTEKGKIFAVSARCPHLGCQLEWNPDELTWDCPCHGSRFDYQGNVVDGPAQRNIKIDIENEALF